MQVSNTALLWASRNASVDTAKILLDNKANCEAKNTEVVVVMVLMPNYG